MNFTTDHEQIRIPRINLVAFVIWFVLLFLPGTLYSQVNRYSRSIAWEVSRPRAIYQDSFITFDPKIRYLSFKDAGYPDETTFLPYFYELITLDAGSVVDSIRIENVEYRKLTPEELRGVQSLEILRENVDFTYSMAYNRGNPAVQLSLLPLRKNKVTGLYERVISFTISLFKRHGIASAPENLPYASSSILATGKWYKIKIFNDGIYKLTYEDLEKIGLANPQDIRVYGNGGKTLPLMNSDWRPDDLQENAIFMEKGTDGTFNKGDFILFYGKGVLSWQYDSVNDFFSHKLNDYSEAAYYFLTTDLGPGKRIETVSQAAGEVTHTVTTFNDYDYYERNLSNLIKSGRQWFDGKLSGTFDTTFVFANIDKPSSVRFKVNAASRSGSTKYFIIRSDGSTLGSFSVGAVNLGAFLGAYAAQNYGFFYLSPSSDQVNITVSYNKTEYADIGWLDYITVNARRNLIMTGNALSFRDIASVGTGNISRFVISGAAAGMQVWDVTDIYNITRIESSFAGNEMSFKIATDTLRELIALLPGAVFTKPTSEGKDLGWIDNQNLHGTATPQMLIATHPEFLQQAERLADFHRTHDDLTVLVATTNQIYNEFSSGAPDVSAIRDFARMLYKRGQNGDSPFKYLLLFGDGSHNNISQASGNPNYILTFQSQASLYHPDSYVSDDFYGLMDDDEGGSDKMENFPLDLGVGRLPVKVKDKDTSEARRVVDKIIGYNQAGNMRDWRNKLLFVADDEDNTLHMRQANDLADWVDTNYPQFAIKKILSDAYQQVASSTGERYPDVNKAIYDNLHKGVLIFNYTGHGNEKGLAAEQLVTREQLSTYTNAPNFPLFITATCEFSRYDDLADDVSGNIKELTSAGEASLLNPDGGSIALLSTSRLVYATENEVLNRNFYTYVFQRDEDGQYYRLGDVIRLTKNKTSKTRNKLNFTLLGDPAIRLAVPENTVVTDSLNGVHISQILDTLRAFTEITIKGHLVDPGNNKLTGFNGTLYPSVYDKALKVSTLDNDNEDTTLEFMIRDNIIYKGKANVINGEFSFSFLVPKDITYSLGNGKIFYYAQDSVTDANGYFNEFIIGGTNLDMYVDEIGPRIDLYVNDENFVYGGITDRNPHIYARISDESGINTCGNGIGHDIVGIIDGDATQPVILNDFYEADLDDYKNGSVRYPLSDLSVGIHSIKLRAWDIYNNPSEAVIEFEVIDKEELVLRNVFNYPNPAGSYTCFQFEHNKAGSDLNVTIDIFDLSGRKIRTLEENVAAGGYNSSPLEWDLKDRGGNPVGNGFYPYRIRVEDKSGHVSVGFQKLLIFRY
ncbi:MAG: type IX secretion system sortase PorU [Bacteroidales bacterium]|nr:type IX secretion system sortase PorU [Bacteroidales bacterium]